MTHGLAYRMKPGQFRVDHGGPHKRITSDGGSIPQQLDNQPSYAGVRRVLGVTVAPERGPNRVGRMPQSNPRPQMAGK